MNFKELSIFIPKSSIFILSMGVLIRGLAMHPKNKDFNPQFQKLIPNFFLLDREGYQK